MKKNVLLMSCLISTATLMLGQTTLNIKVAAALDDHMERIAGVNPQSGGNVGDMMVGSTVLELGNETSTTNPRLIGLRFTGVTIPKFATVMSAYIQFTVKGTTKNADPCVMTINAETAVNPVAYTDNAMSISARAKSVGAITWSVSGATWLTVNSAGTDQRTSELKTLVQPLVFAPGWVSGNAMAFQLKGTGSREVYSYEGDPLKSAELVVTYSLAGGTQTTTTGMQEQTKQNAISLYPNPFKNSFEVNVKMETASDIQISVYDLTGKLVEDKLVKQAAAGVFHYNSVSDLTPGMYFVKVKTNDKEEVIKVISE